MASVTINNSPNSNTEENNKPKKSKGTIKNWIAILSLIIAVLSIVSNVIVTKINNDTIYESTRYEVTFAEKKKIFTKSIENIYDLDYQLFYVKFLVEMILEKFEEYVFGDDNKKLSAEIANQRDSL